MHLGRSPGDIPVLAVPVAVALLPWSPAFSLWTVLFASGVGWWHRGRGTVKAGRFPVLFAAGMVLALLWSAFDAAAPVVATVLDAVKFTVVALGLTLLGSTLDRDRLRRFLHALTVGLTAAVVAAVYRADTLRLGTLDFKTEVQEVVSPNELGHISALTFVTLALTSRPLHANVAKALLVLIAFAVLSRTALIAAFATITIRAALRRASPNSEPLRLFFRYVVVLSAGAAAVIALLVATNADAGGEVLRGRAELWSAAIAAFRDSLPFGAGHGSVSSIKEAYVQTAHIATTAGGFHSAWLDVAVSYGLGAATIILPFLAIALTPSRLAEGSSGHEDPDRLRRAAVFSVLVYGGIRSLLESGGWLTSTEISPSWAVSWMLVGVAFGRTKSRGSPRSSGEWVGGSCSGDLRRPDKQFA